MRCLTARLQQLHGQINLTALHRQLTCCLLHAGPCYRCLFPVAPRPESCSRCSDAGVLGVIPGIIGSLQALEAIKIMSMVGQVASRKLVIFDGLAMRFHTVKLRAR